MFSKSCEYGLRATLFIAQQSLQGNKIGVKTIAEEIGSPEAFTGKILQELTKNNIVRSIKGPYGGFLIDLKTMKKIKLRDVVKAIDGDKIFKGCALGLKNCNEKTPCHLHFKFIEIRNEINAMLGESNLHSIVTDEGNFFLKK
ncbi:MAG: Rrf2 family transcriptional regulator [Capnocytophaga sp.]|nr:Rrf2 family transcriptional regulator [Capnocytophaga sp.]